MSSRLLVDTCVRGYLFFPCCAGLIPQSSHSSSVEIDCFKPSKNTLIGTDAERESVKNQLDSPTPGVACVTDIKMNRSSFGTMDENLPGSITATSDALVTVNVIP